MYNVCSHYNLNLSSKSMGMHMQYLPVNMYVCVFICGHDSPGIQTFCKHSVDKLKRDIERTLTNAGINPETIPGLTDVLNYDPDPFVRRVVFITLRSGVRKCGGTLEQIVLCVVLAVGPLPSYVHLMSFTSLVLLQHAC